MKRLCLFFCALLFVCGCTAGDKSQWDDAMNDFKGNNMQMRGLSGQPKPIKDQD